MTAILPNPFADVSASKEAGAKSAPTNDTPCPCPGVGADKQSPAHQPQKPADQHGKDQAEQHAPVDTGVVVAAVHEFPDIPDFLRRVT